MTAPATPHPPATNIRRNRDFQILWIGQVISSLGSRVSSVAFPLLVLAATGSPTATGAVLFAGSLPLLLFTLPAGAFVDRFDRKRLMIACDAARFIALASVVGAVWFDHVYLPHLFAVAFVEGSGFVFFEVAQRAALRQIVPAPQLPAAIAQIQGREYGALLVGPPLGGVLFGIGRVAPFLVDALSYLVSTLSLLLMRTRLQEEREPTPVHLGREILEGSSYLWQRPLLRVTSLLVTGSDLVINTLYLVVIVVAKERGASSALIGAMFAFIGVGGIIGALIAPAAARVLKPRFVLVGALLLVTMLVPLLAVIPGTITLGLVYGAMFVVFPAWNAVVGAYRIALVPDRLQGRVESVATLLSLGAVPFGSLVVGILLEQLGSTPTIVVLFAIMLSVTGTATCSRAVRDAPRLDELEPVTT